MNLYNKEEESNKNPKREKPEQKQDKHKQSGNPSANL